MLKEFMTNDAWVEERSLVRMHVNEFRMEDTVKVKIHDMRATACDVKWSIASLGHAFVSQQYSAWFHTGLG